MRYKPGKLGDLTQDQLKSYMMERGFKFGLLNYAAVIADVLAECSILSKNPSKLRYGLADAKEHLAAIEKLRDRCFALVKNKISRLNPDTESHLVISCREIEKARRSLKERTEFLAGYLPQLEVRPRPIRKINQIASLWARGFVGGSGRILWEEASELYYWFIKHFEGESNYSELVSRDFDIESIKKLFARQDKKYYALMQSASKSFYFPSILLLPRIRVVSPDRKERAIPIVSIEFFPNKIMTYYESNKGILARETSFRKGGPVSALFQNELLKKQPEKENLLLEIRRV